MKKIIVIDTETNWDNELMSIGTVIADANLLEPIKQNYYVITPNYLKGGMFASELFPKHIKGTIKCSRIEAINDIIHNCSKYEITSAFAYNSAFDSRLLEELSYLKWFDIMKIAANKNYNHKIPESAQVFSTGRLKSGYSAEIICRLLIGDNTYCEKHNALLDAIDELKIMKLLQYPVDKY